MTVDNRLEGAGKVDTAGSVLASEISPCQRRTFVDVVVTQRSLPAGRALTQEAVVLVDTRRSVTTRVTQALAHRQQLHHNTAPWRKVLPQPQRPYGAHLRCMPSARHQFTLRDHGYGDSASRGVPVYVPAFAGTHCAYPRRMARLSWPRWLVTSSESEPVCQRSPIQVLTGPGVG